MEYIILVSKFMLVSGPFLVCPLHSLEGLVARSPNSSTPHIHRVIAAGWITSAQTNPTPTHQPSGLKPDLQSPLRIKRHARCHSRRSTLTPWPSSLPGAFTNSPPMYLSDTDPITKARRLRLVDGTLHLRDGFAKSANARQPLHTT